MGHIDCFSRKFTRVIILFCVNFVLWILFSVLVEVFMKIQGKTQGLKPMLTLPWLEN